MGTNRGKQFEAIIKSVASKSPDVSIDRLIDPTMGYVGIANICDFILYKYPYEYYLECKAITKNTLNYKGHISQTQWDGLLEKSKIPGVMAGILVWFIDWDKTLFIPIQYLEESRLKGDKSFNIKSSDIKHFVLMGKKKRVFFDYDFKSFMKEISDWVKDYWKGELNVTD